MGLMFKKAFTLLEFLVASFLATLLLLLIYQAFGQTALFFRKELKLSPAILEEYFWHREIFSLKTSPLIKKNFLLFFVQDLPGPYWLVYDFKNERYAEHKGPNPPENFENLDWFKNKGIKNLEIYIFRNGNWIQWPLDKGIPSKPYLFKVSLSSGRKVETVFK